MDGQTGKESTIHEIFYDFNRERFAMAVLGGFVILDDPYYKYILCKIYNVFCNMLYAFLISMSFVTIYKKSLAKDMDGMLENIYTLILMILAVTITMLRRSTDASLGLSLKLIKEAVYGVQNDTQAREIVKERIRRTRSSTYACRNLFMPYIVAYSTFVPLFHFLTIHEDTSGRLINPYLPLPIYMPFNTRTTFGFVAAYVLHVIYVIRVQMALQSLLEVYLGGTMQLTAQLEVLNYSLNNIEKRAYTKFMEGEMSLEIMPSVDELYDMPEFQRCLYECLKEDATHHQHILRITNAIKPYVESMNLAATIFCSVIMALLIIMSLQNPTGNLFVPAGLTADIAANYQMCWACQMVMEKSLELLNSLFSTPWYLCGKEFNSMNNIMMTFSQNTIILRATGLSIPVTYEFFVEFISSSYKILNFLR